MSKTSSSNFPVYTAALLVMVHCASCTSLPPRETTPTNKVEELPYGQMPYLDAVPDPIEGFNRCSWAFNDWVFRGVVYPLSFGYNSVTPKPVRTKIGNAG